MRNILMKRPSAQELVPKTEKKKTFVPKFIQKNTKVRKDTLLDSLIHRRTMTIEESQIMLKQPQNQSRSKSHKRDNSPGKPRYLHKVNSAKFSPKKGRHFTESYRTDSKLSEMSEPIDYLSSTGSSHCCPVKKRDFSDLKSYKNGESSTAIRQAGYYSPKIPMTPPAFPTLANLIEQNTESCVFDSTQNSKIMLPSSQGAFSILANRDTAESKYLSKIVSN